jgi:hypothetical protein
VTAAAGVVTISITAATLYAIEATLADDREAEHRPDGKGAYFITLPRDVLDKLNYLRGPGEGFVRATSGSCARHCESNFSGRLWLW